VLPRAAIGAAQAIFSSLLSLRELIPSAPMYAQCPDCLTVFSLEAETLAQARGEVVCGHCGVAFDALATLADQLPPEPFRHLHEHASSVGMPRLELAVYRPPPDPPAVLETTAAPAAAPPPFVRRPRPASERRWPWVITCTVLLLLLGAQLAWAKRDALIADPQLGPWLQNTCATLGCRLPLVRDVDHLHLLARDVQSHPSVPGALIISASVRNDAPFAQPYPVMTLVLSDADGNRIAMRRLRPSEYLGDDALLQAGLAPGGTAALLFEVSDPGQTAVAFDFSFE
jgi:predicted Zn finger-like uncharacterized protein